MHRSCFRSLIETYHIDERVNMKRKIQTGMFAALFWAVAAVVSCHADACTDEELRRDVLEFLTTRCCGNVEARRVLTNEVRFGGDTNRLACVLSEFAQTNDDQIAEWAMWQLKNTRLPRSCRFSTHAQQIQCWVRRPSSPFCGSRE